MKHSLLVICLFVLASCRETEMAGASNAPTEITPVVTPKVVEVSRANPLIAHVVVALCDNKHQGIVPVPATLGNGQDPDGNLYWGALYGVRSFMMRKAGWTLVQKVSKPRDGVLERVILKKHYNRVGGTVSVILIADAWDGRAIRSAIGRFLQYSAGKRSERIVMPDQGLILEAGGSSHLVGYVGHNGLMEFSLNSLDLSCAETVPQMSLALACKSKSYFEGLIPSVPKRYTLLTTNFMAPEAYTLDAAIQAWAQGKGPATIHAVAAGAYAKYQKCGMTGAKRMFSATETQ